MSFSTPKPPAIPTPPAPIKYADERLQQAGQNRRKAITSKRGHRGSLLTGAQGVRTNPNLGTKTLLGQ
ncbi:hypothetical protein [Magnetococcus sp. PR-3]|uniref:hypothetical protein n=1 Tax=Magnetococcus sp. PR-3 TaxID=3120355 RepID=UPI002FCDED91